MDTTMTYIARQASKVAEATDDELQNMEQEGMSMKYSSKELDSLDLSVSQSHESSNQVPQENFGVIEENVATNGNILIMSKEELMIRRELEIEIEMDLENEIKENICQLAFRLLRLYQQQNERNRSSQVKNGAIFSEMNIRIRMKGGSKVDIKEIKKGNGEKSGRPPRMSVSEYKQGNMNPCTKKFDWEKALRSSNTIGNKKLVQPRMLKRKQCNMNSKSLGLRWKC